MESSGNPSTVQPWETYFGETGFKPHAGQRQAFDDAARRDVSDRLLKLPTGYGKTRTAAGVYVIRRGRGIVDRCLWLVATDAQRNQLIPQADRGTGVRGAAISENLSNWFKVPCKETCRADGNYRTFRMNQEGLGEIFIATYQQALLDRTILPEMLRFGRWLIVADEAHHLKLEGQWALRVEELADLAVETLYMTATPLRADELPLHGVPKRPVSDHQDTYDAYPDIDWRQAMDEQVIRQPRAHAQEWELTVEDLNGSPVTITTTDLLEEIRADQIEAGLDKYMAKRRLRFTTQYVHGMFVDALSRLQEKRSRWPGTHQMLVFALNCSHAKFLAQQVFGRLTDADWIGVTRSDGENQAVLSKYLAGELSVLVQVNKAGEGFDNPPTSVLVFLNLIRSEPTIFQQLGRGARRIWDIPHDHDILDVYADTSHPVIKIVRELEPKDEGYQEPGTPRKRGPDDLDWDTPDSLEELEVRWLQTFHYAPEGASPFSAAHVEAAAAYGLSPEDVEDILRRFGRAAAPVAGEPVGESGRLAYYQDQVDRMLATVVGHTIRVLRHGSYDKDLKRAAGQIKKGLNGRWIAVSGTPHGAMLSADFKAKHAWLITVDNELREKKEVPSWLARGL